MWPKCEKQFLFEIGSHYVAQTGLELVVIHLQFPVCWNDWPSYTQFSICIVNVYMISYLFSPTFYFKNFQTREDWSIM
jgi:hypothetical protein